MSKQSEPAPPAVPGRYANVSGPPAELYQRVRGAMTHAHSARFGPERRLVAALAAVITLTLSIACIASEIVYHRSAAGLELAVVANSRVAAVLSLLVGLAVVATTCTMRRGRAGFGASVVWLAAMAVLAGPLYAAITLLVPVHASAAGELEVAGVAISPWGFRCAFIAGLVGGLSLVAFVFALRRAIAPAGAAHGAALGAAAGVWAGLAVFLFCPSGSEQHLLAGHASIVVVLTIIGAALVPRWLRP